MTIYTSNIEGIKQEFIIELNCPHCEKHIKVDVLEMDFEDRPSVSYVGEDASKFGSIVGRAIYSDYVSQIEQNNDTLSSVLAAVVAPTPSVQIMYPIPQAVAESVSFNEVIE